MSAKIMPLSDGAEVVFIKNGRFNTTLVSFNFYMPLTREHAAEYALLPFVLTTCSKQYPDFSKLNFKLSKRFFCLPSNRQHSRRLAAGNDRRPITDCQANGQEELHDQVPGGGGDAGLHLDDLQRQNGH